MIGIAQTFPEMLNKDFIQNFKGNNNCIQVLRKKSLMFYFFGKNNIDIISNYGWYFNLSSSSLFSDHPQNFRNAQINLEKNIENEFGINLNMNEGTFNILLDNNKTQLYNRIPLDIPISLSVLLRDDEDSIEIIPL